MEPSELKKGAYNLAKVIQAEGSEIAAQCQARGAEPDLKFDGNDIQRAIPDRFGVAFSGGGIRSACVGLGILQGLAGARLLSQVHYLSGISGGGYIVGWLTAWTKRLGSLVGVEQRLGNNTRDGARPGVPKPPGYNRHLEPDPLHFLRRYASYLAPRSGLMSGDTLAMVSIYLRNLLLNQALLACCAVALMLLLQGPAFFGSAEGRNGILLKDDWSFTVAGVVNAAAYLSAVVVTLFCLRRLPQTDKREPQNAWVVVVVCSLVACALLWPILPQAYLKWPNWVHCFIVLGLSLLGAILSALFTLRENRKNTATAVERSVGFVILGQSLAWVAVAAGALGLFAGARHWLVSDGSVQVTNSYAVFALPVILVSTVVLSYLWIGVAGNAFPDSKREWLARVAGYLMAAAAVAAMVFALAFYGPLWMHLLFSAWENPTWKKSILSVVLPGGWLFTVAVGLLGANGPKSGSPQKRNAQADASGGKSAMDYIIVIAPPVFLAGLLLLTSWATYALVYRVIVAPCTGEHCAREYLPWADWKSPANEVICCAHGMAVRAELPETDHSKLRWPTAAKQGATPLPADGAYPLDRWIRSHAPWFAEKESSEFSLGEWYHGESQLCQYSLLLLIFVAAAILFSMRLNVNEFSLHLFYRNRLVRAFLGASRLESERKPSPFTGFSAEDDVFLRDLTHDNKFQGPYPIWGTCLNLTTGEDLAWQQRKGASFIFSPLFCGWDYVDSSSVARQPEQPDVDPDAGSPLSKYGYRSTRPRPKGEDEKGNPYPRIPGYGGDGGAPLIGTAMAASGAAVSANMGYHSEPAVAALLTVFNLRLGSWSGNPRNTKTWHRYAPSIGYLFAELIGKSNDSDRYVYLSDGGHFENLGLYELVRRQVRFIICSDADADPDFTFGDLGNAIDHCRRDFGVEIKIGAQHAIKAAEQEGFRDAHYAVGTICYPGQDTPGILLYIKSSLTSDEPSDVLGMKAQDRNFPHDTTLDQFFDEGMFESYRALGQHMMDFLAKESGVDKLAGAADAQKPCAACAREFFKWAKNKAEQEAAAERQTPSQRLVTALTQLMHSGR